MGVPIRFDGSYELDDSGSKFDFGIDYRKTKMTQSTVNTQQDLGSWGISNPRDVSALAGNLMSEFCLACKFDHYDPMSSGALLTAFRGDATALGLTARKARWRFAVELLGRRRTKARSVADFCVKALIFGRVHEHRARARHEAVEIMIVEAHAERNAVCVEKWIVSLQIAAHVGQVSARGICSGRARAVASQRGAIRCEHILTQQLIERNG